jgi:glutathione S-transferase
MSEVEIYSYAACPFAQRTRMTLIEKSIPFKLTEIDLSKGKPDWFKDVSPYGKVPLILHDGNRIYESAIINEYLDEVFPEPPLMPRDPGGRAQARIWMHYCDNYFLPAAFRLRAKGDAEEVAKNRNAFLDCLRFVETEGLRKLSEKGPFFLGETLSLVDLQFAPFLERLPAYKELLGISVPPECTRLAEFLDALSKTKSWRETAHDAAYHIERQRKRSQAA